MPSTEYWSSHAVVAVTGASTTFGLPLACVADSARLLLVNDHAATPGAVVGQWTGSSNVTTRVDAAGSVTIDSMLGVVTSPLPVSSPPPPPVPVAVKVKATRCSGLGLPSTSVA